MQTLAVRAARSLFAGWVLLAFVPELHAQTPKAPRWFEPVWGAPLHCNDMLERFNSRSGEPRVEVVEGC